MGGIAVRREAPLALVRVDVAQVLRRSRQLWQSAAAATGAVLELCRPDAPAYVIGDRLRLAQALGNLIANAIEHGGGAVEVRVRLVRCVDAARGGLGADVTAAVPDCVRIEITDEGPGLPAAGCEPRAPAAPRAGTAGARAGDRELGRGGPRWPARGRTERAGRASRARVAGCARALAGSGRPVARLSGRARSPRRRPGGPWDQRDARASRSSDAHVGSGMSVGYRHPYVRVDIPRSQQQQQQPPLATQCPFDAQRSVVPPFDAGTPLGRNRPDSARSRPPRRAARVPAAVGRRRAHGRRSGSAADACESSRRGED